ncbi:transposase [Streptomyces sp. NPDC057136]|uniref:IS110 family transposase n=1 Tax=Streptomyces sp. NPDC057136 TaxID=3346029 RepID=UPI00362B001E
MNRIWAGIDSGKTHHHCVAIDQDGTKLLSRRVLNGEPELLQLLQRCPRPGRPRHVGPTWPAASLHSFWPS